MHPGFSWAGLNMAASLDASPVSPLVAMIHSVDAALEDIEPGDDETIPQQEDAMFGDPIIGDHDGEDLQMCQPCADDNDGPLIGPCTHRPATPTRIHEGPMEQTLFDASSLPCWMPILRGGQETE